MNDCKVIRAEMIASASADWWINLIKIRCEELYPDKVTIDKSSNIEIIDDSLAKQVSLFRDNLSLQILHHIENNCYLDLTCYFRPSRSLRIIAAKASIPEEYFPQRANMQVYGPTVKVSLDGEDMRPLFVPAKYL